MYKSSDVAKRTRTRHHEYTSNDGLAHLYYGNQKDEEGRWTAVVLVDVGMDFYPLPRGDHLVSNQVERPLYLRRLRFLRGDLKSWHWRGNVSSTGMLVPSLPVPGIRRTWAARLRSYPLPWAGPRFGHPATGACPFRCAGEFESDPKERKTPHLTRSSAEMDELKLWDDWGRRNEASCSIYPSGWGHLDFFFNNGFKFEAKLLCKANTLS